MPIPPELNEEFLLWFRARAEAAWRKYPIRSIEDFLEEERVEGDWIPDWQRGTKWLDGFTNEEINGIERQWQIHFPPDYRLLLTMLSKIDRPLYGISFKGTIPFLDIETYGSCTPFYDWHRDTAEIQRAYDWLIDGFAFDAKHAPQFWRPQWGPLPLTEEEVRDRLQSLVAAAPRLIPLEGWCYLLAEPCQAGNPVLSIHQSDIIIAAPNLRNYLLGSFSRKYGRGAGQNILHPSTHERKLFEDERRRYLRDKQGEYKAIPFWGEFLPPVTRTPLQPIPLKSSSLRPRPPRPPRPQ